MVYKLRFDRFNFMEFNLSPTEIKGKLGDMFILDNSEQWAEFWSPLNGEFFDGSDAGNVIKLPDISLWFTNEIVCNERAYNKVKKNLETYGEWLPICIEGVQYWLLHVTQKTGVDFVDRKNSERTINPIGKVDLIKLSFNESMIDDLLIFKTEYNNFKNIYCTEKFKLLVESNNLKGLIFSDDMTNSPY